MKPPQWLLRYYTKEKYFPTGGTSKIASRIRKGNMKNTKKDSNYVQSGCSYLAAKTLLSYNDLYIESPRV